MKKIILGVLVGFALATTISLAQQPTEQRGNMPGMMEEQKPDEQSPQMMQGMKEMMAKMSKMMDQCSQMMGGMGGMMGSKPESKK